MSFIAPSHQVFFQHVEKSHTSIPQTFSGRLTANLAQPGVICVKIGRSNKSGKELVTEGLEPCLRESWRLFPEYWSNCGHVDFLMPPMTCTGDTGNQTCAEEYIHTDSVLGDLGIHHFSSIGENAKQ